MIPAPAGGFSQYFVLELKERYLTCCQEVISSLTRMHSSRMRTTRFNGHLYRGEYLSQGGVCPGSCVQRVCQEGCVQGMYTPTHRQTHIPRSRGRYPPSNRMTDRYQNITFPQLYLRAVINNSNYQLLAFQIQHLHCPSLKLYGTISSLTRIATETDCEYSVVSSPP